METHLSPLGRGEGRGGAEGGGGVGGVGRAIKRFATSVAAALLNGADANQHRNEKGGHISVEN